jgi:ABC-type uncharacterized transport system substrate-binding protein
LLVVKNRKKNEEVDKKMNDIKNGIDSKKVIFLSLLLVILSIAVFFLFIKGTMPKTSQAELFKQSEDITARRPIELSRKFKIVHVMSYHSPWEWTDQQFRGFKEALGDLDVEYKVVQMDTKRQSSEQWKLKVAAEARELIDTWKPDLVFTGDDNAQQYVAKYYVNTDIPFVFCAVNNDPADYGFVGSKNVTGVLEQLHFEQTIRLLKQLVPTVHEIVIITDPGKMWPPIIQTMKQSESKLPQDVEILGYYVLNTFEEYKKMVKNCQSEVDAIGMLGVFEFKDEKGVNVPLEQVQRWTIENSNLPDFAFWKDRVDKGTLCAVTVSGFEQGRAAGKIARSILTESRSPASFQMKPTEKGVPIVSLARAKKLNINPSSSVLLTAEVVTEFNW